MYMYVPRRHTLSAESIQFKIDLTVRFTCENSRCLTQSLPSTPRSFHHQLAPSQRVQNNCHKMPSKTDPKWAVDLQKRHLATLTNPPDFANWKPDGWKHDNEDAIWLLGKWISGDVMERQSSLMPW